MNCEMKCGNNKPICPDHRGMCTLCCAAAKTYFRQVGRPKMVDLMDCDCSDTEELPMSIKMRRMGAPTMF